MLPRTHASPAQADHHKTCAEHTGGRIDRGARTGDPNFSTNFEVVTKYWSHIWNTSQIIFQQLLLGYNCTFRNFCCEKLSEVEKLVGHFRSIYLCNILDKYKNEQVMRGKQHDIVTLTPTLLHLYLRVFFLINNICSVSTFTYYASLKIYRTC